VNGRAPSGFALVAGNSHGDPGEVLPISLLLGSDRLCCSVREGHDLLGAYLGVEEAQARPTRAVGNETVDGKTTGVACPEAGLDEDYDEMTGRIVGEQSKGAVGLELVAITSSVINRGRPAGRRGRSSL